MATHTHVFQISAEYYEDTDPDEDVPDYTELNIEGCPNEATCGFVNHPKWDYAWEHGEADDFLSEALDTHSHTDKCKTDDGSLHCEVRVSERDDAFTNSGLAALLV